MAQSHFYNDSLKAQLSSRNVLFRYCKDQVFKSQSIRAFRRKCERADRCLQGPTRASSTSHCRINPVAFDVNAVSYAVFTFSVTRTCIQKYDVLTFIKSDMTASF